MNDYLKPRGYDIYYDKERMSVGREYEGAVVTRACVMT